jgi:hypothetical protein
LSNNITGKVCCQQTGFKPILLDKCRGTKKKISMSKCKGGGKKGGGRKGGGGKSGRYCKECCKGKPCGDTCINKEKECHVVKGCAGWKKGCEPNKEENQQPQEEENTDDDAGGDEQPEEKTDDGGDEEPEEKTEGGGDEQPEEKTDGGGSDTDTINKSVS